MPRDAGIPRYEYGRRWELRRTPNGGPEDAIVHARAQREVWGVPVRDPTELDRAGIERGATLFAVPLKEPSSSAQTEPAPRTDAPAIAPQPPSPDVPAQAQPPQSAAPAQAASPDPGAAQTGSASPDPAAPEQPPNKAP